MFNPETSKNRLLCTIPGVATDGEQGLLGVALHPDFPQKPYVYASVVRLVSGVAKNQIVRFATSTGTTCEMQVVFNGGTATPTHVGGRILFGPGGMLYLVVGDKRRPASSQDVATRAGKLLRMTPGGQVPSGNPFSNYTYAYGLRNSFGFGFDPETGFIWQTDNGSGCSDELNRIVRGRNFGWGPSATCTTPPEPPLNTNQDGPNPLLPKRFYTPTIAPTGLAFCSSCGLGPESEGRLFFGAWNTGEIRRVTLTPTRRGVASQSVILDHNQGIVSIERGPDRALYFSDPSSIRRLELA